MIDNRYHPIIRDIDSLAKEFDFSFFIIGAVARDYWFAMHAIDRPRATVDIDFAFYINQPGKFADLVMILEKRKLFNKQVSPHHFRHVGTGIFVDIIPYGADTPDEYAFAETGRRISVIGFHEVFDATKLVGIADDLSVQIVTIYGIIILKWIAWDDRPHERDKDLTDIYAMISNLHDLDKDIHYERNQDLFDTELTLNARNFRIAGRETGKLIDANQLLKKRILDILDLKSERKSGLNIQSRFAARNSLELEEAENLLREYITGMNENS